MFKTIYGEHKEQIIEKKSKFIAVTRNIKSETDAENFLTAQKKIYHDAKHIAYAYVLSESKKKYSDDGEPSSTAGVPILKVLEHRIFFYTIIAVVRYFGGTLLGTGPLSHIYSLAAKNVLEKCEILEFEFYNRIKIYFEYKFLSKINYVLTKNNCFIDEFFYDADIKIIFYVKENLCNKILYNLNEITNGKIFAQEKIKTAGAIYNKKFICCGDL